MGVLSNLEPKSVFSFFETISKIPRGSGNEKAMSDYLVSFAKERGLSVFQDEANNVLICKEGTKGYEAASPVILQGHMDMVCEKNKETKHDFLQEPLKLRIDQDFIHAEGTTLGADNGIAVAYTLAVLDAKELSHPPIEAVFTTDEEVGMHGASCFDLSLLKGKTLLNLDTEEEGHFVISCCGGAKATLSLPADRKEAEKTKIPLTLQIKGLKGGHSGTDIHLQRPNANKLMGRILFAMKNVFQFDLVSLNGGMMDNAIARECEAVLMIEEKERKPLKEFLQKWQDTFIHEFRGSDTGILITAEVLQEKVFSVLSEVVKEQAIAVLMLIPNGVKTISIEMEGEKLVESSSNIGIVKTTEESILFTSAIRSSIASKKEAILETINQLAILTGGKVTVKGSYPAWEFRPDSPILKLCQKVYEEMYGENPIVESIHAGLECGVFSGKNKELDLISFGPNMYDAHTPDERLSISSTIRVWEFLKKVLEELK